jgi:uncharacterized protein (DUF849 family)
VVLVVVVVVGLEDSLVLELGALAPLGKEIVEVKELPR